MRILILALTVTRAWLLSDPTVRYCLCVCVCVRARARLFLCELCAYVCMYAVYIGVNVDLDYEEEGRLLYEDIDLTTSRRVRGYRRIRWTGRGLYMRS